MTYLVSKVLLDSKDFSLFPLVLVLLWALGAFSPLGCVLADVCVDCVLSDVCVACVLSDVCVACVLSGTGSKVVSRVLSITSD